MDGSPRARDVSSGVLCAAGVGGDTGVQSVSEGAACVGGTDPGIGGAEVRLPREPSLAGLRGEEVLLGEADLPREAQRTFAHEQGVVRSAEDFERHGGGIADAFERGDGSGFVQRPVHDGGVELDFAFFVGQAAVADGHLGWVVFDERNATDDCIKERDSGAGEFAGAGGRGCAVPTRDEDGEVLVHRGWLGVTGRGASTRERRRLHGGCLRGGCGLLRRAGSRWNR